jgi:hypothetical protein
VNLGQRSTHGLGLFHFVAEWTVRNVLQHQEVLAGRQHFRCTEELPRTTQQSRLHGQRRRLATVHAEHPTSADSYVEVRESTREELDWLGYPPESTLDLAAIQRAYPIRPFPQPLSVPEPPHDIILLARGV